MSWAEDHTALTVKNQHLMKCYELGMTTLTRGFTIHMSTEITQHCVMTHIEEAVENKEVTLGAFLDIEVVFDNTSYTIIPEAAERNGCEDTI